MNILPKKIDIDKAKAQERKREIDDGLNLAKKIDILRETRLSEEKSLKEWRDTTLEIIQGEIVAYSDTRDALRKEIEEAREIREIMLKPLNLEWKEVNGAKADIKIELDSIELIKNELINKEKSLDIEKENITQITLKVKQNEKDTQKAKSEAISLKEMARHEYEVAHEERISQTELHEKMLEEVRGTQREYEVGIKTNKIKEKQLEEKESELNTKERDLTRQQERMQLVWNEIQK